jgi:hypothetical protein
MFGRLDTQDLDCVKTEVQEPWKGDVKVPALRQLTNVLTEW